jgi:hypothetical protein
LGKAKTVKESFMENVTGKFPLHEETSVTDILLGHSATMYHLLIMSTCFQNKNIQKGTWKAPGDRITQIYHILVSARHSSNATDVRTCSGCSCDTSYYLVKAVLRHKLSNAQECDGVQIKNAILRN